MAWLVLPYHPAWHDAQPGRIVTKVLNKWQDALGAIEPLFLNPNIGVSWMKGGQHLMHTLRSYNKEFAVDAFSIFSDSDHGVEVGVGGGSSFFSV